MPKSEVKPETAKSEGPSTLWLTPEMNRDIDEMMDRGKWAKGVSVQIALKFALSALRAGVNIVEPFATSRGGRSGKSCSSGR